jgi:hypothetical protein
MRILTEVLLTLWAGVGLAFDMSKISKDIGYASDFGGDLPGIPFGWKHGPGFWQQEFKASARDWADA